jgi:hypothetical protein
MFDGQASVIYNVDVKSKRLLCILIIFIILSGMAVIGGTVFIVREVEINIVSADSEVLPNEALSKAKMQSEIEYLKGKSILFSVKESEIQAKIEAAETLVKVKNIKAEFPNKIVIDVRGRYPVYKCTDLGQTMILDAEMRRLPEIWGNDKELIDITDASISFNPVEVGGFATGYTPTDEKKIAQLNIVSNYSFNVQSNGEASQTHIFREISFDPQVEASSSMLKMVMNIRPSAVVPGDGETKIVITTQGQEDFARLLAIVWATVDNVIYDKDNPQVLLKVALDSGKYTIDYSSDGKVVVAYYKNINAENPTVVLVGN